MAMLQNQNTYSIVYQQLTIFKPHKTVTLMLRIQTSTQEYFIEFR